MNTKNNCVTQVLSAKDKIDILLKEYAIIDQHALHHINNYLKILAVLFSLLTLFFGIAIYRKINEAYIILPFLFLAILMVENHIGVSVHCYLKYLATLEDRINYLATNEPVLLFRSKLDVGYFYGFHKLDRIRRLLPFLLFGGPIFGYSAWKAYLYFLYNYSSISAIGYLIILVYRFIKI
jgi:hypothetical protein